MASGEADPQSEVHPEHHPAPGAESGRAVNAFEAGYVDQLYQRWKDDSASVGADWNQFFLGFELGLDRSESGDAPSGTEPARTIRAHSKQGRVDALILSLIHI